MSVSWAKVQQIVLSFPGTEQARTYGRPGFKVGKKFVCALNEEENALGIRISIDERELLMEAEPKIYYVTDHYRPHPAVLVSLKHVSARELRHLIERRWRELAPAKLVKAYDEGRRDDNSRLEQKPSATRRPGEPARKRRKDR